MRQRGAAGGGRADARHNDRGIFGCDLLGRHTSGQAIQDHADRHTSPGHHGLAVHHPWVGRDHLQLISGHDCSGPCRKEERDTITGRAAPASNRFEAGGLTRLELPGGRGDEGGHAAAGGRQRRQTPGDAGRRLFQLAGFLTGPLLENPRRPRAGAGGFVRHLRGENACTRRPGRPPLDPRHDVKVSGARHVRVDAPGMHLSSS